MRDYPAYGRTIAAHVARGLKPMAIVVLLSSRWSYFDHLPKVCMRPDEWRRGKFEFSYLRGLHAVAVPGEDCTERMLGELLVDLMAAGPRELWIWNVDGSKVDDQDRAVGMPLWVLELTRDRELYRGQAKMAAAIMSAAQAKALERWTVEYERKRARSDEEAIEFYLRTEAIKDRLREQLSHPMQAQSEPRAA